MSLRNCILIALATDATPEEIDNARDLLDLIAERNSDSGIDPAVLVNQTVNASGATSPAAPTHGPTPTNTTADTAGATPQLDAAGIPHDSRIHSVPAKLTDKGVWRAKRGLTPALKLQVEAELRATLGAAPADTNPPQPGNAMLNGNALTSTPGANPPQPGATNPPMPGGNMPPMPGAAQIDPAYAALLAFIGQNTQSSTNPNGALNDQYVSDILKHYGVSDGSLQTLAHRLDLVPTIHGWLASVVSGTAG